MGYLQVFHGTHPVAHASAIARKGPDFTRIGGTHGARYGRGFYTSDDISISTAYAAQTGAICICRALRGNVKTQGLNAAETAGSLFKAGYHSVHDPNRREIVLFHPDAISVTHVANLGPDSTMAEQLAAAKEKLDQEHAEQELARQSQLEVCPAGRCFIAQCFAAQRVSVPTSKLQSSVAAPISACAYEKLCSVCRCRHNQLSPIKVYMLICC